VYAFGLDPGMGSDASESDHCSLPFRSGPPTGRFHQTQSL